MLDQLSVEDSFGYKVSIATKAAFLFNMVGKAFFYFMGKQKMDYKMWLASLHDIIAPWAWPYSICSLW